MQKIIDNLQAILDSIEFVETELGGNYIISEMDKNLLKETLDIATNESKPATTISEGVVLVTKLLLAKIDVLKIKNDHYAWSMLGDDGRKALDETLEKINNILDVISV